MERKEMPAPTVPAPASIGLMLSYKCSASCKHCMYACSPSWSADWIERSRLDTVLRQLARYIRPARLGKNSIELNAGLHFTGGEPFLNYELLRDAVERASSYDIPSLFVETNCFWCTNDDKTRDRFSELKGHGLSGILISVNPFYLEYIPFERTDRAIQIGGEIFGRNTMVYQGVYYNEFSRRGIMGTVPFEEYVSEYEPDITGRAEFFLNGRAPYAVPKLLPGVFPKHSARQLCSIPCSPSFIRPWHNHIDNYGNYMPGYCGGISFGNAEKLNEIVGTEIDPEKTPVLRFLAKDDFEGLLRFAEDYGFRLDKEGYYSKCHLCTEIRRYLSAHREFRELAPIEFYQHLL